MIKWNTGAIFYGLIALSIIVMQDYVPLFNTIITTIDGYLNLKILTYTLIVMAGYFTGYFLWQKKK